MNTIQPSKFAEKLGLLRGFGLDPYDMITFQDLVENLFSIHFHIKLVANGDLDV